MAERLTERELSVSSDLSRGSQSCETTDLGITMHRGGVSINRCDSWSSSRSRFSSVIDPDDDSSNDDAKCTFLLYLRKAHASFGIQEARDVTRKPR